jgi:hypothetical protein
MNTVSEILEYAREHNIRLSVNGDRLKVKALNGDLPPEFIEQARRYKPDLIAVLSRWNPELAQAGFCWCLDCVHWQSTESQGAGLWRYADQDSTCTHPDNPYRAQQPLAPRKCQFFKTRYTA